MTCCHEKSPIRASGKSWKEYDNNNNKKKKKCKIKSWNKIGVFEYPFAEWSNTKKSEY